MEYLLINAVSWFVEILMFLLLVRAILSWFATSPYSRLYGIYGMVCSITEPIVAPCRKFTMRLNLGMVDLSVFCAFFLVSIIRKLLIMLIMMIF